ncbi:cell division protein MukB [Canicola haemoglobinophilus]|uniref:Cell division protein MukB n=1 Tax=Canicola haemoglobinophilus TaxID=733 RepID=A0AB38H8B2_9PAST|nr:DMT family transporter [Canicola haemoglobinophilus]STO53944.1 cell division protein MukB [Canicola haemoglobinophilus]STO68477.1 cell division protein MukB [Canicola haemoglobinophilus]
MLYLIIAIFCSVSVSVLLKVARKNNITIDQAIAFNYITAISLCYFLLKPDFQGLGFTEFFQQSEHQGIFLSLGILLPTVFIFMSKAVEYAGIVRADAAQRLALFLQVIAAVVLFNETLSNMKIAGIVIAFLALFCLLTKPTQLIKNVGKSIIFLLLVWLGYGIIGILFKKTALMGEKFPTTLFISFVFAGILMFLYLLFKKTKWTTPSLIGGIILGILNFFNILFYIKAHQSISSSPTIIFAGMDLGVICLGAITGAFFFKEKISKINGVGILLGISAIIFMYAEKLFI